MFEVISDTTQSTVDMVLRVLGEGWRRLATSLRGTE